MLCILLENTHMQTFKSSEPAITERINSVKKAVLTAGQLTPSVQKRLGKIYRQANSDVTKKYSTYSKEWGKDVSGF